MPKLYRLQVAFKNKQSNIALSYLHYEKAKFAFDRLQKDMQSMNDLPVYLGDDAGNMLCVRGTMLDYLLLTDLETDLEAMVTMQSMTAVAQAKAQHLAEKTMPNLQRIDTERA